MTDVLDSTIHFITDSSTPSDQNLDSYAVEVLEVVLEILRAGQEVPREH